MSKRKFRIGDLAEELNLKKFVIRFWEKEFDLQSDRSLGGQRFYTEDDFAQFSLIKDLLYNKGFTIIGARQQLKTLKKSHYSAITPQKIEKKEEIITLKVPAQEVTKEAVLCNSNSTMQPAVVEKIIIEYIPRVPEKFIQTVKTAKEKLLQIRSTLE
jgi:DNA-binding transcriptional MerR regulator